MCWSKTPPIAPRARQIHEENLSDVQKDQTQETASIHPGSARYIKEITEDSVNVNFIAHKQFATIKNMHLNKQQANEVWNNTALPNQQKIHWLANTGSPRSLVTLEKVKAITKSNPSIGTQPYISRAQCKSFNNSNNIKIKGLINLELHSGSWSASTCQVSVVGHNTNNLMRRDILQKLVISVHQAQNPFPGNHIYSVSKIEV